MNYIEWLKSLEQKGILTISNLDGESILHLKTPCKIEISESITQKILREYNSQNEKGGILKISPERVENSTLLKIVDIIFVDNISENPSRSYKFNDEQYYNTLNLIAKEKYLPLHFHTHPTYSEQNQFGELINYLYQSNTSEQDRLVSNIPYNIKGNVKLLMPRSIVISGNSVNRIFIGVYNGLIAPIEFSNQKEEVFRNALDEKIKTVNKYFKNTELTFWHLLGAIGLIFVIIRYNKYSIPILLLLITMLPIYLNGELSDRRYYYAQLSKGKTMIEIPDAKQI